MYYRFEHNSCTTSFSINGDFDPNVVTNILKLVLNEKMGLFIAFLYRK